MLAVNKYHVCGGADLAVVVQVAVVTHHNDIEYSVDSTTIPRGTSCCASIPQ